MPRTAFLFPGQGSQTVGMAGTLCGTSPIAKALFDEASTILGYDLLSVCMHGPQDALNATNICQPAIYVASLAALEQLKVSEPNLVADVVATAGLSLGEYTALVFAGAMSFVDGLRVVHARGTAMQAAAEATPGGMASIIGLDLGEVEALVAESRIAGLIEVANLLCPGNIVVSGSAAAIDELCRLAESRNLRAIRLAVAGAFHTTLMQPADTHLGEALKRVMLHSSKVPIWSNVDAQPHTNATEIADLLVRQVISPVRWEETIRGLMASGVEKFYEIGPGRVLAGLIKRVDRKASLVNISA